MLSVVRQVTPALSPSVYLCPVGLLQQCDWTMIGHADRSG